MPPEEATATISGPQLFPRIIGEYDELGYPLLNHECPFCEAMALTINEWNAIECLTCSWREFNPDSPRAAFRDWETEAKQHPILLADMEG